MTYRITLSPAATRQIRKLDAPVRRRIQAAVELLALDPRPPAATRLVGGAGEWRVRVGDHRIVYEIHDGELLVLVLTVGHRRGLPRSLMREPTCAASDRSDQAGLAEQTDMMTVQVNVQEAKTRLSQLLAAGERGEEIVIARDGTPVARLVPVAAPAPRPVGFVAGAVTDAFFEPLPDDELARWE